MGSILSQVIPKTWKTALEACEGGWRKQFTRDTAIDSPPLQRSLWKRPRGSRRKQAEMRAAEHSWDYVWNGSEYKIAYGSSAQKYVGKLFSHHKAAKPVVLKLPWAVASFRFNWRIPNKSRQLSYAISWQSYLVKASARGPPENRSVVPKGGRGPRMRNPVRNKLRGENPRILHVICTNPRSDQFSNQVVIACGSKTSFGRSTGYTGFYCYFQGARFWVLLMSELPVWNVWT